MEEIAVMKVNWGIIWSIVIALLIFGLIGAILAGWRRKY